MNVDEILKKIRPDLSYSELKEDERVIITNMLLDSEKSQLTPDKIRTYVTEMRLSIETELTKHLNDNPSLWSFLFKWKDDVFLKARLRNYILLEAMLLQPERARRMLESQITNMKG